MPIPLSRLAWLGVLLAAALPAACGRTPPCVANACCADGATCELDGRCRALDARLDLRFARALRVGPRAFAMLDARAVIRGDAMTDAVRLGGTAGRRLVLAFPATTPEGTEVERATLVLHVHDAEPASGELVRVDVSRGKARELDADPRRRSLRREHRARVSRRLEPHPGARLDVDVTELVRDAGPARPFALIVRAGGSDGVAFTSPRSLDPERRPHLDVLLR